MIVVHVLSLAIPPWVGVMSTGDGYGHCWGRNGEFCVAVGPVTTTVGHSPGRLKALTVN